ncbi:MAG TPA: hypothetical protein VJT73_21800 [Polyangiaceae bacterium]|nr:hypothetical protein [Polyangiaceae bacterium]
MPHRYMKDVLRTLASSAALAVIGCSGDPGEVHLPPEPRFDFACRGADGGPPPLHPLVLACTGLYGDEGEHWFSRALGNGVYAFDPGYHLWSDGMDKARFIYLPPGTAIDGRNPNEWKFPVGTKFWKEFSYRGKRIETRYLEKTPDGDWFRTTYRFDADESTAKELTSGELHVPGTDHDSYEIPTQIDCGSCHVGRRDGILGFEAIALSSEKATGLTFGLLKRLGLIENAPERPLIVPGGATERAALGYLHMNCGVACHNENREAFAWWSGLHMRLEAEDLGSVIATNTWKTAVGVTSYSVAPDRKHFFARIAPGEPSKSAIPYRDAERETLLQMPPLATHVIDREGLAIVRKWIAEMAPAKEQ